MIAPLELELWTSAPATDKQERSFVAFRVRQVDTKTTSVPMVVIGCYYPVDAAAYLRVDVLDTYVPVDQHPLLTMEIPKNLEKGKSLCRASD